MTRPIRVLELRSVRGTGGGPEKTILMGAAQSDPARNSVTVCYLRDRRDPIFAIDERAQNLGIDYVEIVERFSFDPSLWPALRRLVRARDVDIVHAHDYKTDLLALLLARAERVMPLATAHGWTGDSRRELVYYWFDQRLLRWYPRVIAVSGQIRDRLVHVGARPERVRVIPNGIDPDGFRRDPARVAEIRDSLGIRPGETVIGSVGRLENQKRFDLLLEAFARVRRSRSGLRLLIAGEGSRHAALETEAERLDLGESFRLLGHRTDVSRVHHAFDLFVQSSDYEGTANTLLEAMALETPIVATAVGGTAELVADGTHALLIPPGDAVEIAKAIERAFADPDATTRRAAAARARVERELSFAARMRALEAVYDELMATQRPGNQS